MVVADTAVRQATRPEALGSLRRRQVAGLALVAAVGLALSGVLGPAVAQETRTTLTWSHPQEPPNWNYWATGASALTVPTFHNILEPLVEKLGDGSIAPLLAESWEISSDGLTYTFRLREAKFHDGSDFDAGDVVYSLLKNKESPQATLRTPLATVTAVEAVDARTVRLTLSQPSQRLLPNLGLMAGIIVPEGAHETLDLASQMIGTGPYTFGEYRPDVHLKLVRFEDYWGEKPFFTEVTHRFIPDETAAINALLAGEIDMIASVFGEGLDRIGTVAQDPKFNVIIPAPFETNYMILSTRAEPLRDIRVRQAIAHAIFRDDYLEAAQAGYGKTTCQWVVPFSEPWNNDYCPYPFDQERSRALLREAGYPDLTLDFPFVNVAEHPTIKDIVVAQLAEVGITLNVRTLDLATWLKQVNTDGDYQFTNITSNVTIDTFVCGGGRQPLGRPDTVECLPEFDELVKTSDAIIDRDEYIAAMAKMAAVFADSAWIIPIHAKSTPTLTRSDLVGHKSYRFRVEMDLRPLRWAD
ncbi:MAG: hypothetical protein KJZ85_06110 [Rhodobacteraceae bacterium]|jgi:peptide/nickel transport system substrate-binding protein|nr:hypothetical protein [Paracoccaceae bacterium]